MKLRSLLTLFICILTYSLTVLTGLIQGQALSLIFINGIKVLIITLVLILFIFILIDCLSKEDAADINNNDSGKKENRSIEKEKEQNSNEFNTSDAGESFAPLTPPVLEVTEKDRGEGN
ncbi:MAG: hypothetical protein ACOC3B_00470 [Bacillota bacterium]